MRRRLFLTLGIAAVTAACASGVPEPAAFDAAHDACAFCRMVGSNGRFAAQIVAPDGAATFFDDIGCLRDYLRRGDAIAAGAVAFVVDHSTGSWVRASDAVYTSQPAVATPMSSHLVAHASADSRDRDSSISGGTPVTVATVFAGVRLPGGVQ